MRPGTRDGRRPADRQAFDLDHDGELMRRYEVGCDRAFHRAVGQLRLLGKDAPARSRDTRATASETERVDGVSRTTKLAETGAQSLVSLILSTVEQPLPETGSGDPLPPPPAPVHDSVEPDMGDGQKLRNEAVAAFIDRDDSAGKTGDRPNQPWKMVDFYETKPLRFLPVEPIQPARRSRTHRRFSRGSRPIARTLATLGGQCSLGRKRRAVSGGLNRGTRLVLNRLIAVVLVRHSPLRNGTRITSRFDERARFGLPRRGSGQ